jgi:hypothetical protein
MEECAMKIVLRILICAAVSIAARPALGETADAGLGGRFNLNLRPRFESVDSAVKPEKAEALTLRSLAGWETAGKGPLDFHAQLIAVNRLAQQNFNDDPAFAATSRFPTVADPDDVDINQLYVDWRGLPNWVVRAGRQSIKLHNVRFVGNVEFRQIMQVFNGVRADFRPNEQWHILLGHMGRIKNIFGLQREMKLELFNADYQFLPGETLTGFAYLLDQPNTGQATGFLDNSNASVGLRLDGARPIRDAWKFLYTFEAATQRDYADGDQRIDANYWRAGAGVQNPGGIWLRLDVEQLGSNGGVYAFQTPLGTNHLFQGWADLFLTTPPQGINDVFISAGGKGEVFAWSTELHRFRSDFGSINFGHEWDIGVSYNFTKSLSGKFEIADYREGDVNPLARRPDTRKLWLTLTYNW